MTELALIVEMHRWVWRRFKDALLEMTPEEADWRPLPEANNINLILRHLRVEAEQHLAALERGEPMPNQVTQAPPLDFSRNLEVLEELFLRFVTVLEKLTPADVRQKTERGYEKFPSEPHLLGYHQAVHLVNHLGQIRSIRNLYSKSRGQPARFFPVNPMFPLE